MSESSNCHDNSSIVILFWCSAGKEMWDIHGTGCLQHGMATDLCPFRSLYWCMHRVSHINFVIILIVEIPVVGRTSTSVLSLWSGYKPTPSYHNCQVAQVVQ